MPITSNQQIIEELDSLRIAIADVRREVRVLANLAGVEEEWAAELLRLEDEDKTRQALIREFIERMEDREDTER